MSASCQRRPAHDDSSGGLTVRAWCGCWFDSGVLDVDPVDLRSARTAVRLEYATVVLVHLRAVLAGSEPNTVRQKRALRTIAVTFFALATYVTVDAAVTLLRSDRPSASPLGLVVTGAAVIGMPTLAWAKRRTARALVAHGHQSSAVLLRADATETMLCAALSLATLIGIGANAALGWWWADPLAGLVVVFFAVREGHEAWEGELLD